VVGGSDRDTFMTRSGCMACGNSSGFPELYPIVRHWSKVIRGFKNMSHHQVQELRSFDPRTAACGSSLLGGAPSGLLAYASWEALDFMCMHSMFFLLQVLDCYGLCDLPMSLD
jgi:hypothetical protein